MKQNCGLLPRFRAETSQQALENHTIKSSFIGSKQWTCVVIADISCKVIRQNNSVIVV